MTALQPDGKYRSANQAVHISSFQTVKLCFEICHRLLKVFCLVRVKNGCLKDVQCSFCFSCTTFHVSTGQQVCSTCGLGFQVTNVLERMRHLWMDVKSSNNI